MLGNPVCPHSEMGLREQPDEGGQEGEPPWAVPVGPLWAPSLGPKGLESLEPQRVKARGPRLVFKAL